MDFFIPSAFILIEGTNAYISSPNSIAFSRLETRTNCAASPNISPALSPNGLHALV